MDENLGLDIDSRDTTELIAVAKGFSQDEVDKARNKIQPLFSEHIAQNDVADKSIRLYMAIREIVKREGWEYYTIQSFPGLGDIYSAICLVQSMMLENGIGTSTLSDFNTALVVKLITDLSHERVYYGDLQHIDITTNEVKIIGDGTCPPSLAGKSGSAGFAEHGIPTKGEAGGLSVRLVCKSGEGVIAHLGRRNGSFEMVVAKCSIFESSPPELQARLNECAIPFWPHSFIKVKVIWIILSLLGKMSMPSSAMAITSMKTCWPSAN
jgi:L-arabinose isomerase